MSLKTFSLGEECFQVEFQKVVEQIQKTAVLHWSPIDWEVQSSAAFPAAYPSTPQLSYNLRPCFGDYIHLWFYASAVSGTGATIKLTVRRNGVEEDFVETSIGTGGMIEFALVIDLTGGVTLGDASGEDLELLIYAKRNSGATAFRVADMRIMSTNSGTVADSMWWS